MRKLDFIGIGVQKAGTTTLYELLCRHPQIQMGSTKEIHYFDNDSRDWSNPDYSAYHRFFDENDPRPVWGEVIPRYIFHEPSLERIQRYRPDIKLIAIFRDPIERAFSQWKMIRSRGDERLEFLGAIQTNEPLRASTPGKNNELPRTYIERGLYGEQVQRLLGLFPRQNILFLDFEDLIGDQAATLRRVTGFLGIEPLSEDSSPVQAYAHAIPEGSAGMTDPARHYLAQRYREDFRLFRSLTGLPTGRWMIQSLLGDEPAMAVKRAAS